MAKKTAAASPKTAAPKTAAPKRAAKPAAPKKSSLSVTIDYPQDGETVRPGHYSIRLTVSAPAEVQLRVNGGEWLSCREAVGHYWLDWSAAPAVLEARARAGKGRWSASPARAVAVIEA
jgi:hypothetical protein